MALLTAGWLLRTGICSRILRSFWVLDYILLLLLLLLVLLLLLFLLLFVFCLTGQLFPRLFHFKMGSTIHLVNSDERFFTGQILSFLPNCNCQSTERSCSKCEITKFVTIPTRLLCGLTGDESALVHAAGRRSASAGRRHIPLSRRRCRCAAWFLRQRTIRKRKISAESGRRLPTAEVAVLAGLWTWLARKVYYTLTTWPVSARPTAGWRFGVAVTRWSRSTQLLYIEPG